MNPFVPLYEQCNKGDPADKLRSLGEGPIIVDIEPVGACNFRCVMCPTGLGMLGRPSGMMTDYTYARILDKFPQAAIRYIGWGEPTMHPDLGDFVKAAGRLTHVNTNGSLMTPLLIEELIAAGLSSIKFSFQGVSREGFLRMRKRDFFDELLSVIEDFREARTGSTPWISASTTVTDETEEQIVAFAARMGHIVDHLSIGRTTFDFIDTENIPKSRKSGFDAAFQAKEIRHPVPCPEVYNKLTIHWDGSVRVCCNDYSGKTNLGNVNTDSAESIWHAAEIEAYRARLAEKRYEGPLCSVCDNYMDLS